MTIAPAARRITADEYFALDLPERHTQLINGELVVTFANLRHDAVSAWIWKQLDNWVESKRGSGRAGLAVAVELGEREVYGPDVWWLRTDRIPDRDATRIVGPTDLAVEVRSPSTWRYDVGTKKRVYETAGVRELWFVDTKSDSVLVYRRSSPESAVFDVELELTTDEQLTSPLLPGLVIDVAELFDR